MNDAARRVTATLFLVSLAASFASFGVVSSLHDVAVHFGRVEPGGSLRNVVGLSGSVLGLGLGAVRLCSLVALPITAAADHRGRTSVLRASLAAGLIVTALAAFSPRYWVFVACFALARPLLTTASTLVQVLTVELTATGQRIHRLVIMAAGAGVGAGLSAIVHGLIRGGGAFRWLFALALVPAVALWPLRHAIPEPTRHVERSDVARLGSVPRALRGRLAIVATVAFAAGMVTGPSNGFTFVYGEGVLGMSAGAVAALVTSSALTGLAGLLVGRRLARTRGRRPTVAWGVAATAIAATYAYSGGRLSFVLGYLVGVGAAGLLAPAASAMSTEVFTHATRATAAGWAAVAGVLGATAGLALFG